MTTSSCTSGGTVRFRNGSLLVRLVPWIAKTSSGSGLSPAESSFLPLASIGRDDAFQARRAQFARLQFEEELLARLHLHAIAIHFAVLLQAAVHHARNGHRALHRLHQLRQIADREQEGQRGGIGQRDAW